jgi:regulator of sirC expression with transglutaminase-like and TPR domain
MSVEAFRRAIARAEEEIDLAEAMLAISKSYSPELDIAGYLSRLDAMAEDLRAWLKPDMNAPATLAALNVYLFEREGFCGSSENNYYDPRNSYLDQVIERRTGLPITLSVLYLELGWRLGLPLSGVSFPGHFLVKLPVEGGEVVLDPFARGVSLDEEDVRRRLREVYGQHSPPIPVQEALRAAGKRDILARAWRNLKGIWLSENKPEQALIACDGLLALDPAAPVEYRDRGLCSLRMECFRAAQSDLRRYLELEPEADDLEDVRAALVEVRYVIDRLN